jgi:hypothetical protein
MRHALIALLLVGVAHAGPPKLKTIDVKPVADKLAVYKDEVGNYYVSPQARAFEKSEEAGKWVFYGDGKTMYRQRIIGSSSDDKGLAWSLWSPRARDVTAASLTLQTNNMYIACRASSQVDGNGHRALTQLTADEAATFLKSAKFYPELHTRGAHFLARDDDARYYYVDALRDEHGGNGFRVFVGMKGAMKQLPISNMARDSAGEIFATKSGQLKFVNGKTESAFWIKGGKKIELTVVPVFENRYVIYRDLGIYGSLGVVCDDQ